MQDEIEEAFEVSAELKAVLLESIAQCERGETIESLRRGSSRRQSRRKNRSPRVYPWEKGDPTIRERASARERNRFARNFLSPAKAGSRFRGSR